MEDNEELNYIGEFMKCCSRNRTFPECGLLHLLEDSFSSLECTIPKDTTMYRARVYYNDINDRIRNLFTNPELEKIDINGNYVTTEFNKITESFIKKNQAGFLGYDEKDSFVNPNKNTVIEGRCNHKFSPCLYASKEIGTAISELKPLINERISVATIKVIKDLKMIDLRLSYTHPFKNVCGLFMHSPTMDYPEAYVYTQTICDFVKKFGYDGIIYSSCQTIVGENYAIFNYNKCKAIASKVFEVESIDVKYKQV